LDETFDPPVIFGYLGFDCAIFKGGVLGPPIPTFAVLDAGFNLGDLLKSSPVYAQLLDKALYSAIAADKTNARAQSAAKRMDALAAYVPNEFTEYSGPSGTNHLLTATKLTTDQLHNTNGAPAYFDFHAFRSVLDQSVNALEQALKLSSFQLKDTDGHERTVGAASPDRRRLEGALAYYSSLRRRTAEDAEVQAAYSDAYGYFLEKLLR
jgi:hypothetical protein